MEIRLANKDDLEEIIKIESICFPPSEAASKEVMEERFKAFGENFLVAVEDEKVVGFINGCTTDKACLPDKLYSDTTLHNPKGKYQTVFGLDVLPQYRNKGTAAMLLEEFIELSKKRGKKGIVLTCKDFLIHYYEKFGFKHEGISISSHGGSKWNDMILLFEKALT